MGWSAGKLVCICPPEHPIIDIWNNRVQNGRRIGRKIYVLVFSEFFFDFVMFYLDDWSLICYTQPQHRLYYKRKSTIMLIKGEGFNISSR